MATTFATVPLLVSYLGQEQYGVWSTLLALMTWIMFFDLGIGSGLRNKVAQSIATGKIGEAQGYISTGYTLIGLLTLGMWLLLSIGIQLATWQELLNIDSISENTLKHTIQVAISFIALNFWLNLITSILGAFQKSSIVALGHLISNLLLFVSISTLLYSSQTSITHLTAIYGTALVGTNAGLTFWFFYRNPALRPTFSLVTSLMSPIIKTGLQFFALQLTALIIFTTDRLLITHFFGPTHVTQYDIALKFFSIATFVHNLVLMPLWSAYTDAYERGDIIWMRQMLVRQLYFFGALVGFVIVMAVSSRTIIYYWIGNDMSISSNLIILLPILVLVSSWNSIFAVLVNGVGNIKLQLVTSAMAITLNIPISTFLVHYTSLGVGSIVVGMICSLLPAAIALPVQVHFSVLRQRNPVLTN